MRKTAVREEDDVRLEAGERQNRHYKKAKPGNPDFLLPFQTVSHQDGTGLGEI